MPYPNALAQANPQRNLLAAQMLPSSGEGSYLRQQFPQVYGFLGGLAGTAPDEMQGSVMDPNTAAVRQGASYGYLPGLVASSAPLGKAGAGLGMLAGATRGAQKFDNSALMAGKAMAKIDQITGLPLNADGTVTLFHHTNKNAAQSIQKTGVLKSAGEPSVYLTTERTPTTGYGDTVVPVKVNPSKLNLDDEFPNGRLDFSIDVGKPGGSVKVAPVPSFVAPQDEALRLAQQRASLPPSQGGLGLPAGNTPEQRAAAMGFDIDVLHGTKNDIRNIDLANAGQNTGNPNAKLGFFTTPNPQEASRYATLHSNKLGSNVMPLIAKSGNTYQMPYKELDDLAMMQYNLLMQDKSYDPNSIIKFGDIAAQKAAAERLQKYGQLANEKVLQRRNELINEGFDSAVVLPNKKMEEFIVLNPENLRSRFAAFDPFRRTAAIAATMGVAAPDLLAGQSPQQTPQFNNSALMK